MRCGHRDCDTKSQQKPLFWWRLKLIISIMFNLQVAGGDLPPNSDKAILPPDILSSIIGQYGDTNLPHPLIFRISNDAHSTYIGVKEFSGSDFTITLPQFILDKLQSNAGDQVTVELVDNIPKGTFLKLKPLQFYPEINNWKYYLESTLNNFYTILTKNDKLVVNNYEFLIEDLSDETVSIIDTDLILDIVPLNDIMANQQLNFNIDNSEELNLPLSKNLELIPFSNDSKIKIFKVNVFKISTAITITIKSSNFYNSDLIIGNDKLINLENFKFTTIDQDFEIQQNGGVKTITIPIDYIQTIADSCKHDLLEGFAEEDEINNWIYMVPFTWEFTDTVELSIQEAKAETEDPKPISSLEDDNTVICSNCNKSINKNQYQLHEAFCFKNNITCSCGTVFLKSIPPNHWHCPNCLEFSDSELFKFKHEKLNHQIYKCDKCPEEHLYANYVDLITNHKSSTCPNKLHECKFCHLIVEQGRATYFDNFENLTNHENTCGNKTDECYKCHKLIKRKQFKKHFKLHELNQKLTNETFKLNFNKCSNENCVNLASLDNHMNLCNHCFGPLYNSVYDPNHAKLQARMERKYMLQLNKGCDYENCQNYYCKRNNKIGSIKEILQTIHNQLFSQIAQPPLPINKDKPMQATTNKLWFCVSESMNYKLILFNNFKTEYPEELVIKGLNEIKQIDQETLQTWLQNNN